MAGDVQGMYLCIQGEFKRNWGARQAGGACTMERKKRRPCKGTGQPKLPLMFRC